MTISKFQGEHRFLSNFHPVEVTMDGQLYLSTEHAYQAAKTTNLATRTMIARTFNPGKAKRLGRLAALRPDWEEVKLEVMLDLLRKKFAHPKLRTKLLATGTEQLVEGNTWGDTFWGVCDGMGDNHLGRLLMQVRDEIKE